MRDNVGEVGQRGAGRVLAALGLLLSLGCDGEEGRPLRVAGLVELSDRQPQTVAVDAEGRFWLGEPGRMRIVDSDGDTVAAVKLGPGGVGRVVGWSETLAYLRVSDSLFAVPLEGGPPTARRGALSGVPLLLDVRHRAVLQGARSGAVLAHDPDSLEPVWAWAALGSPTTGLAESPLGDRIYQAIGGEGGPARVLVRDLQTGRELTSTTAAAPLEQLVAGEEGDLYGVAREGRRAVVVALDAAGGKLEVRWRRTLSMAEQAAEVRLVPVEGGVVVRGLGPRVGLRWLSAEDGRVLGRTRTDPLDVWFEPGSGLWALFPGELRRLE